MNDQRDTGDQLVHLAHRVLSLIMTVVSLLFLIVFGLLVFYGVLLVQPQDVPREAASQIKDLILNLWGQITPYVGQFVRLVAPVFVLIFALGLLYRLRTEGATPFDRSKLLLTKRSRPVDHRNNMPLAAGWPRRSRCAKQHRLSCCWFLLWQAQDIRRTGLTSSLERTATGTAVSAAHVKR
jgi:hypothetical protein